MNHGHKTALITGASQGIGFALAKECAAQGYQVVLVARDEQVLQERVRELEHSYSVSAQYIVKDLSLPAAAEELHKTITSQEISVDILINNAGFGTYGPFESIDLLQTQAMIQVNILTLTTLTKLFLSDMRKKNYGKILQVASTAAFEPGPLMAVYFATKAFVLSFSEALTEELRGTGITITTLCPGPTNTQFSARAKATRSGIFHDKSMFTADMVARIGFSALMHGKRVVIPGFKNKCLVFLTRITPKSLLLRVMKFMMKEY